jgi:hypothetical protein
MQGLSVLEAAERLGRDPVELAVDLILEAGNRTTMVNFVMAEADVDFLLPKPESMIGSDGRSFSPGGPAGGGHPHPRSYGAFPRVLARYVREKHLLTLEGAVHKMTGKPARSSAWTAGGSCGRGILPTWSCLIRPPSGIEPHSSSRISSPTAFTGCLLTGTLPWIRGGSRATSSAGSSPRPGDVRRRQARIVEADRFIVIL